MPALAVWTIVVLLIIRLSVGIALDLTDWRIARAALPLRPGLRADPDEHRIGAPTRSPLP